MMEFWSAGKCPEDKVKLVDVKLNNDIYGYSLALTYNIESAESISEFHIPRVSLPFTERGITIERGGYSPDMVRADLGFGMMPLRAGKDGHYFTSKVLKTKTQEMTLEEIEKKLGHKVKLVSKK